MAVEDWRVKREVERTRRNGVEAAGSEHREDRGKELERVRKSR